VAVLDFDTFVGDIAALVRFLEPGWQKDAACREHPEVTWHPKRGDPTEPAKQVCRGCLVRASCLAYALADETLTGVWGGTSNQERHAARRRGVDAATLTAELASGRGDRVRGL
jgi:WhiB family transcriptional regulator, redox-sensing transcriptional regulator